MSALAVAGVTAKHVVTPHTAAEMSDAIRSLAADGAAFALLGGGTELALGNAPRALDTLVRTTGLDRVVEYAPEDQTITVEAGITFAELDRVLAEHGQMLPLDVPDRHRATVGGAIAANTSGRRRLRYGTVRDLIVGVGIVRPDGTPARGGGKVVKNVAGFDLPKLMVGSLGTLGAITRATFRLYPLPEARAALRIDVESTAVLDRLTALLVHERLEPESVALYDRRTLVVTFAGTAAGVEEQAARLSARCGALAAPLSDLELEAFDQREQAVRRDGDWRVRVAVPPAVDVSAPGAALAAQPIAVPVAYPLTGLALHAFADAPDIAALRAAVHTASRGAGAVVVTAMPDAARATTDAWGPPPEGFPLMRALKANFDPRGLCNPGRFVGGL